MIKLSIHTFGLGLIAAAAGAGSVRAQSGLRVEAGVTASSVRLRTSLSNGLERRSGMSFGGEGGIWWRGLGIQAGYLEGRLGTDGNVPRYEQVEGFALLGVSPLRGLVISAGPHARAFVANGVTNRWVFWTLRTRYQLAIVGPTIGGFGEVWGAVTGSSSIPEPFGSARGGAAGLVLNLAEGRVAVRLGYGIDESRLGSGGRRDTIENLTLGIGFRTR